MSTRKTREWTIGLDFVPMSKLFVDPSYQRKIKPKHVDRIVNNFKEDLFVPLTIAPRANGKYAVTDGQHRFMALKRLGFTKAPCTIVTGGAVSKEAEIFVNQSEGTKRLVPEDKFRAMVQKGDKTAVAVNSMLYELSFKLSQTKSESPRTIQSVNSLLSIYNRFGGTILKATLQVMADAWGTKHVFLNAAVINGIAQFFKVYGEQPQFDQTRLVTVLSRTTPKLLADKAKEGTMLTAILDAYNYRCRDNTKLPDLVQLASMAPKA